jgi:hypothetical protein
MAVEEEITLGQLVAVEFWDPGSKGSIKPNSTNFS